MNAARNRFSVVVDASAPVPPYPADTRAKGWRFDLDYERIEQSDTWVLAPADMRPWLLMLWLTAWKQTPCGSLPTQDELIAARIGMDLRQFRAHRDLLMRGWEVHNDGRYYHHVITEQVLSLIAGREKENAWKRGQRKKNQPLTEQCPPGHGDDSGRNQCGVHAPSPSPSPSPKEIPSLPTVEKVAKDADAPVASANCPHAEILKLFAQHLPMARQPAEWNAQRQTLLRTRWREKANRQNLDWWARLFGYVAKSEFLTGQSSTPGRKPFELDLPWLLKAENFLKVIEGKYHSEVDA